MADSAQTSFDPTQIEQGRVYRDKRGHEWKVLAWIRPNARREFFIDCEREVATHLHALDEKRKTGKFTPIKSFAKTIAEAVA